MSGTGALILQPLIPSLSGCISSAKLNALFGHDRTAASAFARYSAPKSSFSTCRESFASSANNSGASFAQLPFPSHKPQLTTIFMMPPQGSLIQTRCVTPYVRLANIPHYAVLSHGCCYKSAYASTLKCHQGVRITSESFYVMHRFTSGILHNKSGQSRILRGAYRWFCAMSALATGLRCHLRPEVAAAEDLSFEARGTLNARTQI
jgi:hypothetical protein